MKKANILALFLLVLVVQVVFVPHISIGGIQPDLPFLVAYAAGVHWGFLRGMAAGAGLGFMVDVAGGAAVGLSAMSGMMVGAAAGLLGGHVYRPTPAVHAGGLFGSVFLGGMTTLILVQLLYSAYEWLDGMGAIVLPQTLYTVAVGLPGVLIFLYRIEKGESVRKSREGNAA